MKSKIYSGDSAIVWTDEAGTVLAEFLSDLNLSAVSEVFVLTDEHTQMYCLPNLLKFLPSDTEFITIPPGETSKSIEICEIIYAHLINSQADRNSVFVNLGGGVVSDVGGFVASTYKRGIKFINIPTTLLAMVDASSGGKTGIDFRMIKNSIGTFCNPETVIIDPVFLETLPDIEWKCGLVEMLKHALLDGKDHWSILKSICGSIQNGELNRDTKNAVIKQIIASVNYKVSVVEIDFKEKNTRKYLNFGHTIGHAIESVFLATDDNSIRHGEAIAVGLICESFISFRKCDLSKDKMNEINHVLTKIFSRRVLSSVQIDQILLAVKNDKKAAHQRAAFVLLQDFGAPVLNDNISDELIIESIQYYNNL